MDRRRCLQRFHGFLSQKYQHQRALWHRSLAAKLAYAQCRFYPEMVSELLDRLEMMTVSDTSQALLTNAENILKMLAKNKNTRQT